MDDLLGLLSDDQTFERLMHAIANVNQSQIGSCGGGGGGECGSCQGG
jgi:hypothetical protein